MTNPSDEPKLHVDSDWKAQAQAEKERLAKQEAERATKHGPRGGDALPPADFRSLVGILASQAMSGLGMYGDEKGRVIVDPVGAKFAIDLLGVLEEKTKGNLAPDEATELEQVVRELRMRFVQVMQLIARQGEVDVASGEPAAIGGAPRTRTDPVPLGSGPGTSSTIPAHPAKPGGPAPPSSAGPRLIVP